METDERRKQREEVVLEPIEGPQHQSNRSKITNWVVIAALLLAFVGLFRILAWGLDNTPVLEVKNAPFPTRTIREHPTAGGVVFLDADYCKNKNVEGDLRISFLSDSREVFLPLTKERGETGCQRVEFPILIPKDISPGEYRVKFRVTYDKNPLKQNEVIEFESQSVIIDPTQ